MSDIPSGNEIIKKSLYNWIKLHVDITSLIELLDSTTFMLFITNLFNVNTTLDYINMNIPPLTTTTISIPKDEQHLLDILPILQLKYQVNKITTLQNNKNLTFTIHTPQFIPNQLKDEIYSWVKYILSDYITASILLPLTDLNRMNSHYLIAILHYHHPSIVSLLFDNNVTLSFALELAHQHYKIPIWIDPTEPLDEITIVNYLVELACVLEQPTSEQIMTRKYDIQHYSTDNNITRTLTSTFTLQQLKITKTTRTKYANETGLEEFDSRVSILTEKINGLHHRLMLIVPTRSSNYSPSSVDSMDFFLTDDNTTSSTSRLHDNSSHASSSTSHNEDAINTMIQQQLIRVLHPLQAAEEDYSTYDRNFKSLQSEFQTLTDGDLNLLNNYLSEELPLVLRQDPKVVNTKTHLLQLYHNLAMEFERSEIVLSNFRRGFAFARMCHSIRHELDLVQHKMVKSITTYHDIEELEFHMDKTSNMVMTLKTNFNDLLIEQESSSDVSYLNKFESISNKNQLVKTWVEEVRIWFAEAERIRQWIEKRIDRLNNTTLPDDPLLSIQLPASREQVESLNASHSVLEREIELFDKEDMARLRSHVKTLTGSGRQDKDLSPADTTTIEITLTTLMTLDKLMHLLRKKSYDLQVLTQRVCWEEEYDKSMIWLKETDNDIHEFLKSSARWTLSEMENDNDALNREKLMLKEKQKEIIVQKLLSLERKMAEFDQGQFQATVDSFQDLDNTSSIELPHHLESRQDHCEQLFENLMKRMTFSRNVVEQRLNVMDFLYQTEIVLEDSKLLELDFMDLEAKSHFTDKNDREMTTRVQTLHEKIIQLVTSTANRIPYPVPSLAIDEKDNQIANDNISQLVATKRNLLITQSERLDDKLVKYRNILLLFKKQEEYVDDATRLNDWADERINMIKKSKLNLNESTPTVEDLTRFQRDLDSILSKLKNGKENEVIDLLTKIGLLLEESSFVIDKDGSLFELSQRLQETFDRLQQSIEEFQLNLNLLVKKIRDGNTFFENSKLLLAFIVETRHSIPSLKQKCGFITGQSEEQDQYRFDMLYQSLDKIKSDFNQQQPQFNQLCTESDVNQEVTFIQSELKDNWNLLFKDIQELESFSTVVSEWYHRQRRLSLVETNLILGLNKELAQLAANGWSEQELVAIQSKLDQAFKELKKIGNDIHSIHNNKEDPLQMANYSCARDRHASLTKKVKTVSNNLNALKNNANNALAYTAFLAQSEKLLTQSQHQKQLISHRMSNVGSSQFSLKPLNDMDTLHKNTLGSNSKSEQDCQQLQKQLSLLMGSAKELEDEGYDSSTISEPVKRIRDNLTVITDLIQLEKKQAMFIKKTFIHTKAANDLKTWMDHCSEAITQLPTDICLNDEQELMEELDNLEQKMLEMKPTIQAFEQMKSKILNNINLSELSFNPEQVQSDFLKRETTILNAWTDLKKQHQQARQALDKQKRHVDIARKVKSILTQIGDMKDRISAVRICRNTHLDEGIENRDLKTVLSCPLTSIPTEHRLSSAKAELSILDRDLDLHLHPSIEELDVMLQGDAIFSDQRNEITLAVRSLMDLLKAKRQAITEAEKMEGFLTVMEELEVLLLALTEVVSRADPSHARMIDGNYSRTDLQALLIDLDTRYRYYEPKINELLDESNQVAENLLDDTRVVDCLKQLSNKWLELQTEYEAKKQDLISRIGPLALNFDTLDVTEGMLQQRGLKAAANLKRMSTPVLKQPPSPKTMQSTPRYMTGYTRTNKTSFTSTSPPPPPIPSATAARANHRKSMGAMSPTARRVATRQLAAKQQRAMTKTPETYIADPKNDLDVALGDILNDSPYKILVKMVPGEVGKYWFGNENPKLAYCRILRSRMVMVRVGGGWVELSQFLRDHALLEGDFVHGGLNTSRLRDGFLNTTVGRNPPTIRGGHGAIEPPTLRESRSTPHHHRGISPSPTYGHGIKTGNKFLVTVDGEGNKVEVKMTKAKSKDTKFVTPRRMNI